MTVKCRIGVDEDDPETRLPEFLEHMQRAGIRRIAVHARKALLRGLNPKQNRNVPPLDHPLVLRMRKQFPALGIVVNGGIDSLDRALELIGEGADGAMIGRAAYHRPGDILLPADRRLCGQGRDLAPEDIVERMIPYIEQCNAEGVATGRITRHMVGLFAGRPGARLWRRTISEQSAGREGGTGWLAEICDQVAQA